MLNLLVSGTVTYFVVFSNNQYRRDSNQQPFFILYFFTNHTFQTAENVHNIPVV